MGPGDSTGCQGPAPLWVQGSELTAKASTTVDSGCSSGNKGQHPLRVQGAALTSTTVGPGGRTDSKGQYHCGSRGQHWQQRPAPIEGPGGSNGSQ